MRGLWQRLFVSLQFSLLQHSPSMHCLPPGSCISLVIFLMSLLHPTPNSTACSYILLFFFALTPSLFSSFWQPHGSSSRLKLSKVQLSMNSSIVTPQKHRKSTVLSVE